MKRGKMKASRFLAVGIVAALTSSFAAAQSVAEAAQKEKERRESLKGKPVVVVTMADLSKTQKKPALLIPPAAESTTAPVPAAAAPKEGEGPAGQEKSTSELREEARKKFEEKKAELENRVKTAADLVDLLNLKMNALWQQFYSYNTMNTKDQIQRSITETYQKYLAAKDDLAKAKDELDRLTESGGKETFPPVIK
jgi:hypothetical protein